MGLFDRLRNLVVRREQPTQRSRWWPFDIPSQNQMNAEEALCVSVVWACVMAITTALSSSRWNIFALDDKGNRTRLPDDRLDYILNVRPNPEMPAVNMREAMMVHALTWGNAYAEIVRNARGDVAELWPLYPDRMIPRREIEAPYALFYQYLDQYGEKVVLPPERVLHIRGPGISGLMGDNIVARAAKGMALAAAQERFAGTYFGNNTVLGGILKTPKKLNPEAHARLKKDWSDMYGGGFKSHKPALLEDGLDFVPIDGDAEKSQLVESRTFQIEEVCRWYGVPPHKVQHLMRATLNNIEQLGIEFVRDALTPWARRHEQEVDYKLLPQRAPWRITSIDTGWLTQGDFKTRMEGYTMARNTGVFSVNQILQREGENTIGAQGDIRIVPANMVKLEDVGKQPAAPSGGTPKGTGSQPGADSQDAADARTAPKNLAREAIVVLFADVLNRHRKRLAAREEDLRRAGKPEPEIAAHMARERDRQRPKLVADCAEALALVERLYSRRPKDEDVIATAFAVERGEDAKTAVIRLLPAPATVKGDVHVTAT